MASAVEESGASEPKEMGSVMKVLMPKVGGRADGKRVSQRGAGEAWLVGSSRSTTPSPELAGSEDAVLAALEGHLDVDLFLRGNVLTLDGDAEEVARPRRWSESWST